VIEIATLLQEASGIKVPIEFAPHRPGEQQESFVNADKARELLGWTPQVSLAEGLAITFAWFEQRVSGVTV
jgi:UDP-glucose 4-epimerase